MTSPGISQLPPLRATGRLARLRSLFPSAAIAEDTGPTDPDGEAGLGALLVTSLVNIRWLTGFSGSAAALLVTDDRSVLVTDGRYRTQANEQLASAGVADQVDVVIGGHVDQRSALLEAIGGSVSTLGLEAGVVTWAEQRSWQELFANVSLVATSGLVEGLRVVKDEAELARMAEAARIADRALEEVLPLLAAVGQKGRQLSEAEFAAELDHAMRRGGAEDRAFETIVAGGENSAKPHAEPGARCFRPGDSVVVDFGAQYDGYRSDMTRTFSIGGEPDGEMAGVFSVVGRAQQAGVDTVAPGVETGRVDEACRSIIADAGWAGYFEHGTGHGVGLDIHEAPPVSSGSTAILEPGCVVTVEPGVYLPGLGGVRVEDTLVVTDSGQRSLTQFPKDVSV